MDPAIDAEIAALARDRESSATVLVGRAIALLRRADSRQTLEAIAAGLTRAQPSMAGFRTVPALALSAADSGTALARLAERLNRAPAAVARYAVDLILTGRRSGPVRVVTCSRSLMVESALVALAGQAELTVCCSEGRPALEGRALGEALAARGIAAELFSDAAIGSSVGSADAVLLGADAIGRTHFINKVGTGALCALAASLGVPIYVLTGREKILPVETLDALPLGSGEPAEIWTSTEERLIVRNPYFERVSTDYLSSVVTDAGRLAPAEVESARLI